MARDLNIDTEVVVCPIVREPDGLALSSRNVYLKDGDRQAAAVLHRSLQAAKEEIRAGERKLAVILAKVRTVVAAEPRVELDYVEIADAETLATSDDARSSRLLAARRARRWHSPHR